MARVAREGRGRILTTYCTNCGRAAVQGAKFCAACGTALVLLEPDASDASTIESAPTEAEKITSAHPVGPTERTRDGATPGDATPDGATPGDASVATDSVMSAPGATAPSPSASDERPVRRPAGRLSQDERQARLALLTSAIHRRRLLAAASSGMFGLLLALFVIVYLLRLPSSGPSSVPSGLAWIALALGLAGLAAAIILFVPLAKLSAQPRSQDDAPPGEPAVIPVIAAMLAGTLVAIGAYLGFGLTSVGQPAVYVGPAKTTNSSAPPSTAPLSTGPSAPPSSLARGSSSPPSTGPSSGSANTFGTQAAKNAACLSGKPSSAAGSPILTEAQAAERSTSMTLKPGNQLYVYGFATGGAQASGNFARGTYASVADAAKNVVDAFAITTSPSDAYATRTSANAMIGAALDHFSSCTVSYTTETEPGAALASTSFNVSRKGSLAVFIALSGGGQAITLSGPSNIVADAVVPNSSKIAVVVAHAYLGPGSYKATESTSPRIPGQNSANNPDVGDLLAVLVLSPGS